MRKLLTLLLGLLLVPDMDAAEVKFDSPGAGNPILPGYFADPTVRKFGDTYYLYSTTDGTAGGLGPSQVWTSKDFVNWTIQPMNWPQTHYIWAPDVMKGKDGLYHLLYCQPCQLYQGVSETPTGPWRNILGEGEDEDEAVLVPDRMVPMAITLDGQTFVDDDGSVYLYWGTWGIYPNHGCGVGKMAEDMKSFTDTALIPNTQATDFFEAPYVFKRNGIYYFTYSSGSCHDHTYRVQYATSTVGPMGPFQFGDNNPILETNADRTIHGPGHHSILQEGENYYIVYHRHNLPNATRGFHRQICADKLEFDAQGRILKVKASHQGIGALQKNTQPYPNLAFCKTVRASSTYSDAFRPEYAVDDNNATLWRPATTGREWLQIDLGKVKPVTNIWIQFEYATSFYQYLLETSVDGRTWTVFADRRSNTQAGSPMMESSKAKARYVRLTLTGNEKNGFYGAVWNVKVFSKGVNPPQPTGLFNGQKEQAAPARKGLIFELNADDYPMTGTMNRISDRKDSSLGFDADDVPVPVRPKDHRSAFVFNGKQQFISNFPLPETFTGNGPYSMLAWIFVEQLSDHDCFLDLTASDGELEKVAFGYGRNPADGISSHNGSHEDMGLTEVKAEGRWQHLAVVFDGYMERIYLDGKLMKEKNMLLLLPPSDFLTLGSRFRGGDAFRNSLHSLRLYDVPLSAEEVQAQALEGIPIAPQLWAAQQAGKRLDDLDEGLGKATFKALSPHLMKVGFEDFENDRALRFRFVNVITGFNSGWISEPRCIDPSVSPNQLFDYRIEVEDCFGNGRSQEIGGRTDVAPFRIMEDEFDRPAGNTLRKGGCNWKGWPTGMSDETALIEGGNLVLASAGRNFQLSGEDNGPFLYVDVLGDFLAETEVVDFTGMTDQKGVSFNEGGIMVMLDDALMTGEQKVLHAGVFPYYNNGNIFTQLLYGQRIQTVNNKGWTPDRFFQVEHEGDLFYFRTSPDGKNWTEMPGSPVFYPLEIGKKVKVGLYQVTYTERQGEFRFGWFRLWQAK